MTRRTEPDVPHPEDFPDIESWERAMLELDAQESAEPLRAPRPLTLDPDLPEDPTAVDLYAGAAAMDQDLRRVAAGLPVLNLNLGAALALMKEGRFQSLGFVRWKDYLREHVGVSVPTAAAWRQRARMLRDRPVLLKAMLHGVLEETSVSELLKVLPLDGSLDQEGLELGTRLSVPALQELLATRSEDLQEWLLQNTSPVTKPLALDAPEGGPGEWWTLDQSLEEYFDLMEAERELAPVAGEPLSRLHTLEALAANYHAGAPLPEWQPGPLPLDEPPGAARDSKTAPDLEVLDGAWRMLERGPVDVQISEEFLRDFPHHPHELQERIDALLRCRQRLGLILGLLLSRFRGLGHHREFGFQNVVDYALARLGLQPSTTYELLKRESQLPRGLWDAVWEGVLHVSQAELLAPFLAANNEEAWVEFAGCRSVRNLREWMAVMEAYRCLDGVAWLEGGALPPGLQDRLEDWRTRVAALREERVAQEKARLDGFRAAGELPPEMVRMWAGLLVEAEREAKPKWHTRPPLASDRWTFRRLPAEARTVRPETLPEPLREWVAPLGVTELSELPADLAAALQKEVGELRCFRTSEVRSLAGLSRRVRTSSPRPSPDRVQTRVWVPDELKPILEAGFEAACRAEGRALAREEALALWIRDFFAELCDARRLMVRARRELFMRQGGLCAVPGCTCVAEHEHHIRERRKGGGNESWNRVFLCMAHHQFFVHRGRIRLSGSAPDGLHWAIGVVEGTARQVYENEVRVEGPGMLGAETLRPAA